jgi:acyl-CoA dehydrogenase
MFLEAFTRLLETQCPLSVVRAVQANPAAAEPLRAALDESGFLRLLLPEEQGGAALPLADFADLVMAAGAALLPVPFAEPAVEKLLGRPVPPKAAAALTAAQMAGATRRLLEMTLTQVTTRQQFGRPLGSFQAVQHQLAVMAEEVAAATLAAHIGMAGPGFTPARSAVATIRCGEAADTVAAIAHQLHGAIGVTSEFDLQLFTTQLRAWQRSLGGAGNWATVLARHRLADAPPDSATFIRTHLQPGGTP